MNAFTREVSPRLERCELAHVSRAPTALKLARKQHAQFATELTELGVQIEPLESLSDDPDGGVGPRSVKSKPSVIGRPPRHFHG